MSLPGGANACWVLPFLEPLLTHTSYDCVVGGIAGRPESAQSMKVLALLVGSLVIVVMKNEGATKSFASETASQVWSYLKGVLNASFVQDSFGIEWNDSSPLVALVDWPECVIRQSRRNPINGYGRGTKVAGGGVEL
ncbi:hypothetical protein L2E82_45610 [Cichorium intybus]|uniref:Uncharacterized protein n=1 Tax=Cichorium intybus TaxID=13427 RepID=A0ACB8ZTF3_CICIN|nr:hypothetical protein L2E82_45610 [Cichorium intybus]